MSWKVAETIYFARDLGAAVTHYTESLGFELVGHWDFGFALVKSPDGHGIGLMALEAWRGDDAESGQLPSPRLSLQTDDIDAEVKRLAEAGVDIEDVRDGRDMRWTTFRDAEGNPFLLWDDGSGSLSG